MYFSRFVIEYGFSGLISNMYTHGFYILCYNAASRGASVLLYIL